MIVRKRNQPQGVVDILELLYFDIGVGKLGWAIFGHWGKIGTGEDCFCCEVLVVGSNCYLLMEMLLLIVNNIISLDYPIKYW